MISSKWFSLLSLIVYMFIVSCNSAPTQIAIESIESTSTKIVTSAPSPTVTPAPTVDCLAPNEPTLSIKFDQDIVTVGDTIIIRPELNGVFYAINPNESYLRINSEPFAKFDWASGEIHPYTPAQVELLSIDSTNTKPLYTLQAISPGKFNITMSVEGEVTTSYQAQDGKCGHGLEFASIHSNPVTIIILDKD